MKKTRKSNAVSVDAEAVELYQRFVSMKPLFSKKWVMAGEKEHQESEPLRGITLFIGTKSGKQLVKMMKDDDVPDSAEVFVNMLRATLISKRRAESLLELVTACHNRFNYALAFRDDGDQIRAMAEASHSQ